MNELFVAHEQIAAAKGFAALVPCAGKGLLFCVCAFVALDVLDAAKTFCAVLAGQGFWFEGAALGVDLEHVVTWARAVSVSVSCLLCL